MLQSDFPRIVAAFAIGVTEHKTNIFPSNALVNTLFDEKIQTPDMINLRHLLSKPMYPIHVLVSQQMAIVPAAEADDSMIHRLRVEKWKSFLKSSQPQILDTNKSVALPYIQQIRDLDVLCNNEHPDLSSPAYLALSHNCTINRRISNDSQLWLQVFEDRERHTPVNWSQITHITYIAELFDVPELVVMAMIGVILLMQDFPRVIIACDWTQEKDNFLFDKNFIIELMERKKDEEMMEVAHLLAKPLPAIFKPDDSTLKTV